MHYMEIPYIWGWTHWCIVLTRS